MSEIQKQDNWKSRTYMMGAMGGAFFGLLASYLFTRAAEEDAERHGGKPEPIKTAQLLSLALATLGLMRQISEMGKPKK